MINEQVEELLQLLEDCRLPSREKELMREYIVHGKYPKNKTDQIAFYRGYRRIRLITRLGERLKEYKLMKK